MDLLSESSGRTDEALAKVAGTTQMAAKIMEQSMQQLERSIGEAWHGIDICWKKAKLWWGMFLSGGDANKAVEEYENRIKIKNSSTRYVICICKNGRNATTR